LIHLKNIKRSGKKSYLPAEKLTDFLDISFNIDEKYTKIIEKHRKIANIKRIGICNRE